MMLMVAGIVVLLARVPHTKVGVIVFFWKLEEHHVA